MDYGKSGGVRQDAKAPRHKEHNERGTAKNPYRAADAKAELLARMKAAAEARKAEKPADDIAG